MVTSFEVKDVLVLLVVPRWSDEMVKVIICLTTKLLSWGFYEGEISQTFGDGASSLQS
ncbi:MAG TPA: hypothetical protein VLC79_08035 [Cellvibrio sp.]|nr:hypothetical protein [Cellvibrio sp.]